MAGDQREAQAQAQVRAESAAALDRVQEKKAQQGVETKPSLATQAEKEKAEQQQVVEELLKAESLDEYNLPPVDWSVGKKAFVATWTKRIDAYLEGTPLEGFGIVDAVG